jgi:hypothetical protein
MSAAERIQPAATPTGIAPLPGLADEALADRAPQPAASAANDNREPACPPASLAFGPGIPAYGDALPVRWPRVFP